MQTIGKLKSVGSYKMHKTHHSVTVKIIINGTFRAPEVTQNRKPRYNPDTRFRDANDR